jgi:hypothetical protein
MFSQKHKLIAVFVSVIIATALITTVVIHATTTSPSTLTISSGIYPGTPSYTVWTEGGSCYAKNAFGLTVYSDATGYADAVIQYCLTALASTGGTVYIKEGMYSILGALSITGNNVVVEGEGNGGTILTATSPYSEIFEIMPLTGVFNYLITLKNMWLRGNDLAGSVGVFCFANGANISDVRYENLVIMNFALAGIQIRASPTGKTWNHWIENCEIEDIKTGYGVYLSNTYGTDLGSIDRVNIYNCHFYDNVHSLYCDTPYVWNVDFSSNTVDRDRNDTIYSYYGRQWTIENNKIYDSGNITRNTYGGIVVNGTAGAYAPSTWIISGNLIENHWTPNCMNYSIWILGSITHMVISANTLVSATQGTGIKMVGLIDDPSIRTFGNEGFVTECNGQQLTCINGTAIAHNLSGTPTSVTLTLYGSVTINSTAWYFAPTVLSVNSTYIIVNFMMNNGGNYVAVPLANNRTIFWAAFFGS